MRPAAIRRSVFCAALASLLAFGGTVSANAGVIGPWTTVEPGVITFRADGEEMKLIATHRGTAKEVIDGFWKQKAYVHWRVRILTVGHVWYSTNMTWTRLDIVERIFANAPEMDSVPHRNGFAGNMTFTPGEFRAILRRLRDNTTAQLKAEITAYGAESSAEDAVLYGPNGDVWDAATRWAKWQGYPKSFAGFVVPTPTMTSANVPAGVTYRLSGTPRRVVATAALPNGVWVRLTGLNVHGVLGDYPSASAAAASAMGAWRWIFANS